MHDELGDELQVGAWIEIVRDAQAMMLRMAAVRLPPTSSQVKSQFFLPRQSRRIAS
jgi:hypothetical protein